MGKTEKGKYTVEDRDGVASVISPEGDVVRSYSDSDGGDTYAGADADARNGEYWA